jgi:Tfp pilus assembly protein PilN
MKHLNFIPAELRPKLELPVILIPVGLAAVFFLYMSASVISTVSTMHNSEAELAKVEAQSSDLKLKIESMGAAKTRLKLEESLGSMRKILAKKNYWSAVFREMSVLIPEGVWLTGFSDHKEKAKPEPRGTRNPAAAVAPAEPDVLLIKGESSSQEMIAQFLVGLEKSHHFAGVQLMFTEKETDVRPSRYKFQFSVPITTATDGGGS